MNRNYPVVASVLLLHVLALWALHTGLLRRAIELVVPVQLIADMVEPPRAEIAPPQPAPAPPPKPLPKTARPVEPAPTATPVAAPEPAPVLTTTGPSTVAVAQAPAAPTPAPSPALAAVPSARPAAAAPPAPPKIELPSSDADYLNNPRPPYPPMSRKLRETGTVRISVLIGIDGQALKAEIRQSSGFDRLDKMALETVLKWRYLPGKRDGVPEAMSFIVPLVFALD